MAFHRKHPPHGFLFRKCSSTKMSWHGGTNSIYSKVGLSYLFILLLLMLTALKETTLPPLTPSEATQDLVGYEPTTGNNP